MKNIFKREKQTVPKMTFGIRLVSERFDREQHKWADYLNGRTARKSRASKLIGLIVFCVLFGGSSILLILNAFSKQGESLSIGKISVPVYVMPKNTVSEFIPLAILTNKQHENIQRFKRAMDSLRSTSDGKGIYDSICKARPGLMDSVIYIEEMFLQQSNLK
ncbi:MAG: hypothetical protein ABIN94_07905 [Ferruginibacter sp.]